MYEAAGAHSSRALLMVRLLYEAALRRDELVQVQASDLKERVDGWTLSIRRGGRVLKSIEIKEHLARAIKCEMSEHPNTPWLFPGFGGHLGQRQVNRLLTSIVPGLHPYRLRVSHCNDALQEGLRVQDVSHTLSIRANTALRHEDPADKLRRSSTAMSLLD